jgi:hypothetical protein
MGPRKVAFFIGEVSHDIQLAMQKKLLATGWDVMIAPTTQDIFGLAKLNETSVAFAFVDGPLIWDELNRVRDHVPLIAMGKFPNKNSGQHKMRPQNWDEWFAAWIDPIDGLEMIERAAYKALSRRLSAQAA